MEGIRKGGRGEWVGEGGEEDEGSSWREEGEGNERWGRRRRVTRTYIPIILEKAN